MYKTFASFNVFNTAVTTFQPVYRQKVETRFLKYHKISAICMGVWNVKVNSTMLKMLLKFVRYFPQIYYIYFVVTICMGYMDIHDDDHRKSEMLQFILIYTFVVLKIILGQSKAVQKLTELTLQEETKLMHEDEVVTKIYLDGCKYNHKIFYLLSSLIIMGAFQLLSIGYINFTAYDDQLAQGLTPNVELFLSQWIPFGWEKYYKRVFIYQSFTGLLSGGYIIAFDSLFASLINFPSVRLNILGHKFNNLKKHLKTNVKDNKRILKSFIADHQAIIK